MRINLLDECGDRVDHVDVDMSLATSIGVVRHEDRTFVFHCINSSVSVDFVETQVLDTSTLS